MSDTAGPIQIGGAGTTPPQPPGSHQRTQLPPKQVRGMESPAVVMLHPAQWNGNSGWWSHDGILLGGIAIDGPFPGEGQEPPEGPHKTLLAYSPTRIPRVWDGKKFGITVEYESERPESRFKFRVYYSCGDPSERKLWEARYMEGQNNGKRRLTFNLAPQFVVGDELFCCTLEIIRVQPDPVLIYGSWLEIGV